MLADSWLCHCQNNLSSALHKTVAFVVLMGLESNMLHMSYSMFRGVSSAASGFISLYSVGAVGWLSVMLCQSCFDM